MRYLKAPAILALFLLICVNATNAAPKLTLQDANALFSMANASYRAQKYQEAAEAYRELIEAGYDSAPVLYNLGTTAARLGNSGEALGYLMRAHRLRPRDENIRANLNRVKQEHAIATGLAEDAANVEAAGRPWDRIIGFFTAEEWLIIMWGFIMLASIGGAMLFIMQKKSARAVAKSLMSVGVVGFLVVVIPGIAQVYRTRVIDQVVVLQSAEILSGPADRFTRVAQLEEGQVIRSLGSQNAGYYHVRLDSGLQGYVNSKLLMPL